MTETEALETLRTTDRRRADVAAATSRAVWALINRHGWSVSRVARECGMSRPTVYTHLRWVDAFGGEVDA